MLATALGLDLAALYEEAAERAMSAGEAGLAVELYYESDVRPAKLVARYLAIKKADVAVSYLAAALRRPASLPIPELRHMATVLLQCHAYVALAAQATIGRCARADVQTHIHTSIHAYITHTHSLRL